MKLNIDDIGRAGLGIFGTKPPTQRELLRAEQLLADAPVHSPLAVARYFEGMEERNVDGEPYNAEWRVRSNPVIVAFFLQATNYGEGATDQTRWCAAFINWCLMRAKQPHTHSASSGSFRCFGTAVSPPRTGDVAVFKNRGQDELCRGTGHVAFWLDADPKWVNVLGGNQGNRVKVSRYPATEAGAGSLPWLTTVRRIE
ncbi:hypothetical protein GmRootV59_54380 (plasmid) [Variovorax sp. V59]|uniref:TIGR02594 family protein n=1 Tax=unclassified Variovorax TaxID=663243 RepID=UPI0034E8D2A2